MPDRWLSRCDTAGASTEGSAIVRGGASRVRDRQRATPRCWDTTGWRQAPRTRALANGASGHAMDYDDTQLSSSPDRVFGLLTHPTVPVPPRRWPSVNVSARRDACFSKRSSSDSEVECKIAEAIRPGSLPARIPQHRHDRHLRRGGQRRETAEAAAAEDRARARHRRQHELRHPREFRIDDQAAARRPRGRERCHGGGTRVSRLHRRATIRLDGEWGFFQVLGGGADLARIVPALGKPHSISRARRVDQAAPVRPRSAIRPWMRCSRS